MKKVSEFLQASSELVREAAEKKVRLRKKARRVYAESTYALKEAIGSSGISTYAEIADTIYGNDAIPAGTLSSITSRLRKRTLDEIAFNDLKPILRNDYDKARYEVQRSILVADLFYVKGRSVTSIHIWKKTLAIARRHGFTLEACHCAMRLCYQYAFRKRQADHYNMTRMYQTLLKQAAAESEAAKKYQGILMLVKEKWFFSPAISHKSAAALRHTLALARKYKTCELWLTTFRLSIYHRYITQDYKGLLRTCAKYRSFLLSNIHLQQDSRWADIALHEMNACIALRNFSYGLRAAEENKKYMRPENSNWLGYRENYFQLLMHAEEYESAKRLYDEVLNSRWRRKMSPYQHDVWQVNFAYLHFALNDSEAIKLFTPVRFFNRLKKIKTDKEGLNFLIEVGQCMFLLAQKTSANLQEFEDNFRNYIKRHIDRRQHYRSYYFALLLLTLFKYERDVEKAEAIGKKFYEKLKDFQHNAPRDREITELIPYDHLWPMMLRTMKQG